MRSECDRKMESGHGVMCLTTCRKKQWNWEKEHVRQKRVQMGKWTRRKHRTIAVQQEGGNYEGPFSERSEEAAAAHAAKSENDSESCDPGPSVKTVVMRTPHAARTWITALMK